ncbi:phage tail protein, partial [Escherichia coli]|uniref:phage tail protein n=1 Tax=Escherichia coli TaxID=562 RepID=UPI0039089621
GKAPSSHTHPWNQITGVPTASLTAKGITQLSSATNSTSEVLAATPKAVKAAYDLANGKYTAQDATTAQKGIVQLSSATNSTSEVLAATPKAVKAAYDLANGKQAADATLTALAALATAADKLPYFTGVDRAALTALTSVGRAILGKTSIQSVLDYLGLGDGSGRLINCQVFKSSGKYTPTKGTRFIIVEIVGGGGAGGGCQVGYPNNAACGGGGMSGEYVKARVDNPTVTTVTIGYGGTGASASVGAPGGTTSFGNTIIAKGGLGGNVLAEGTAPGVVGPYGAYIEPGFTGANIIGSGSGYNSPGVRYSGSLAMGGPGGDSILGAGAGSQAIVGEGINANGHGGGGGGACVYGGATQQRAGGSGMAGIAIIWEYA